MIIGIILVVLIVAAFFYFVNVQKDLIAKEERVKNALSTIGVQTKSRWDALKQLANTVSGYKSHEVDTLLKVVEARSGYTPTTFEQIKESEKDISKAMGALNVVVEQYPELKANTVFENMMNSINDYENKVRISRQVYNDTATMLNQMVRAFPTSIVAGMINIQPYSYLETSEETQEMPDLKF